MHVSRSQSAFLWLLHYETTPPPTPHNGGEGGRLPDESQSLQAFWSTAESRKSRKFFLVESGIHLTIGIRNPDSTDKESEIQVGMWNLQTGIQNPRLSWITLHGLIGDTFYKNSSPYFDLLA